MAFQTPTFGHINMNLVKQQLAKTPEGRAALAAPPAKTSDGKDIDPLLSLAFRKGLIKDTDFAGTDLVSNAQGTVFHAPDDLAGLKQFLEFGGAAVGGTALLGGGAAAGVGTTGAGTAGTTAAAAAPLVTKAATSSWLAPLIGAGASTIGTIAGAKIAANANSDAAKIQSADTAKALAAAQEEQAYKRKQFADYQARLQPYQQQGAAAFANLSDILGRAGIPNVRN